MPPVNYRVSQPVAVTEAFRAVLARAAAEGRLGRVLAAARYMFDELAYDPARFGEARARLHGLELDRRIAFARPLVVEFAVHEATRQVFVSRVGLDD